MQFIGIVIRRYRGRWFRFRKKQPIFGGVAEKIDRRGGRRKTRHHAKENRKIEEKFQWQDEVRITSIRCAGRRNSIFELRKNMPLCKISPPSPPRGKI